MSFEVSSEGLLYAKEGFVGLIQILTAALIELHYVLYISLQYK